MFWIIFVSTVLLLAYYGSLNSIFQQRERNICRLLMLILLSYIISFGGIVATDNIEYVRRFQLSQKLSEFVTLENFSFGSERIIMDEGYARVPIEFGFETISFIGNLIGLGAPGLFFVVALFVNYEYMKIIFRSPMPMLASFIFIISPIYFQQANLMRQSIAIALFIHSLSYLYKRQIVKYIITISIGMTFHISILLTLPFLLLLFLKIDDKLYLVTKIVLFIAWLFSVFVAFGYIDPYEIVDTLLSLFTGSDFARHISLDDDLGEQSGFSILDNFLFLLILLRREKDDYIYMIVACIACILLNISAQLIFVKRMVYYFMAIFPYYYPKVLYKDNYFKNNIWDYCALCFVCSFYIYKKYFIGIIIEGKNPLGQAFYPLSDFFS